MRSTLSSCINGTATMVSSFFLLGFSLAIVSSLDVAPIEDGVSKKTDYQPQQIHLSWTALKLQQMHFRPEQFGIRKENARKFFHNPTPGQDGEMTVTWVTMKVPPKAANGHKPKISVHYGTSQSDLTESVIASQTTFVDGGDKHATQYIFRATMHGLTPSTEYFYSVGTKTYHSEPVQFRAMPPKATSSWSPRLMIFGDLGVKNDRSLAEMQKEMNAGMHDMAIHNGDIAYNLDSKDGQRGNDFLKEIEPIASKVPYMVTVGNHDEAYNFSHYINRFSMPGNSDNFFYSLDMGPLHVVLFASELLYFPKYGLEQIHRQYRWLDDDLRRARAANKQWIVAIAHRPMYCSSRDFLDCNAKYSLLRDGFEREQVNGIEPLLYKYGVDLYLAAHHHVYERCWPLYKSEIRNGTTAGRPYHDALATVHIMSGAAGNKHKKGHFLDKAYSFSAFRSRNYGFMRMRVHNATHMDLDEVGITKHGGTKVIDKFSLTKSEVLPAWLRSQ